jgi:hypothetical protein
VYSKDPIAVALFRKKDFALSQIKLREADNLGKEKVFQCHKRLEGTNGILIEPPCTAPGMKTRRDNVNS